MTLDLNLGADQAQVLASVQEVLADRYPLSRFQHGGRGPDALADAAGLGWFGLGVAEADGGAGMGLAEEALLFRELGRHLVTPSVLASSLAVHLAQAAGEAGLAAAVMDGTARVCLATRLAGNRPGLPPHALLDAEGASHVLLWTATELILAPAPTLAALDGGHCVDPAVSLRRGTVGSLVTLGGAAARQLLDRADLLVAAQLLGLAEGAMALAVEYAKVRHQFGQPIGAFQAVKHRCADMRVRVEVLEALLTVASLSGRALDIAAARLLAPGYALENASAGIQVHGAMGYTAECDAHRFLLRAHLLENLGTGRAEREAAMADIPREDGAIRALTPGAGDQTGQPPFTSSTLPVI